MRTSAGIGTVAFTTDLSVAPVPQVVPKVNAAIAAALAQARPALQPPPYCQAKARAIPLEGGGKPVGTGRCPGRWRRDGLPRSPELDGDMLALAGGLVDEMQLGRGPLPTCSSISLSATDYVGHNYGTEGEEMCLQLLELDREIGDFLDAARQQGHRLCGGVDRGSWRQGHPRARAARRRARCDRADLALSASTWAEVTAQLGIAGPGLFGELSAISTSIHAVAGRPAARCSTRPSPLSGAPAGRSGVHRGRDRRDSAADGSPDKWSLIERVRASHSSRAARRLVRHPQEGRHANPRHRHGFVATHGSAVGL